MSSTAISPSIATKPKARLEFLDSLRGLAAIYVVAYHTALVPNPQLKMPTWLAPWLLNGGSGVTLFFIISAFTLCFTLDGRQHAPHSTYNFYVRRIFRILPLYYVWLVIMIVYYYGFLGFAVAFRAYKLVFLLHTLFGYNFVPGQQEGIVMASWTLGVEMVFYALFPWIFRLVNTLLRAGAFLIVTLVVAYLHYLVVGQHPAWLVAGYKIYLSIFCQLPVFAAGMVTYFIWKALQGKSLPAPLTASVLLTGVTGFFLLPYAWGSRLPLTIAYPMAIIYAFLLIGISFYPTLPIINRVSVFVGVISYSLYLNHAPLVKLLSPVFEQIYSWPGPNGLHYMVCLLALFIPLIAFSYGTYRLIEQPFISLAKRFTR